jgi:plastocyanin domain-containing protein
MKKLILIIALVMAMGLKTGLAAEQQKFVAPIDKDGIQRVDIVGGSYYFKPNYIILKVNVPVELKVRKEPGLTPHDLVIKAPEAGMQVKVELSTEPKVVTFTPTKTGKFPFYCDKKFLFFESHREKGMEGTIEVRE